MLGKLLKYEMKATARTFLPLYVVILVIACINRLFGMERNEFYELNDFGGILLLVLVALFIALAVITCVVIIQRFYKNLFSDEGYLMFTLPVTIRSLLWSKTITTIIWVFCSGVVAVLTFFILMADATLFKEILTIWQTYDLSHAADWGYLFGAMAQLGLMMLTQGLLSLFIIYLSMSISQISKFNKHRVAVSVISFFAITFVLNYIAYIFFNPFFTFSSSMTQVQWFFVVFNAVAAIGIFEATVYILRNHLNLE